MDHRTDALLDLAPPSATRNWSELPLDALLLVFTRLDLSDIPMGAALLCQSWLVAAKVPSLWQCVGMSSQELVEQKFRYGVCDLLCAMAMLAVDCSGGQLQKFYRRRFVTAELLNYIGDSFFLERNEDEFCKEPIDVEIPLMRQLHTLELYDCDINCKGLKGIVDNCPRLEKLHIDGYFNDELEMDKDLRMKCARVKNLKLDTWKEPHYDYFGGYSSEEEYHSVDE
ncbi:unnamed protein product [Urochloa decumbens]|uniref:F-box domain-containing protein n=1 Tax=Urochloa decumbens TaxID=240449 RepID=A0ABC9BLQ2_9POAL